MDPKKPMTPFMINSRNSLTISWPAQVAPVTFLAALLAALRAIKSMTLIYQNIKK